MIDIKTIRADPALIKAAVKDKNEKTDIDALLAIDESRRKLQFDFDTLKAKQNQVSVTIANRKKYKEDANDLIAEMSSVAEKLKSIHNELTDANNRLEKMLLTVPNIPHVDVPRGHDESSNRFVKEWGAKPSFDFKPLDHLEIADKNGLLDLSRGARISGSGFPVYTALGARLERAVINFMLEYHIQKHGYVELAVPLLVTRQTMTGTGQLPKLEEDMYHVSEDDLFLIPTAEVPVTNMHACEILAQAQLPIKYVAYTPCFRREAGSYGKDTKGLQRLHQFNKVEMVRFVEPHQSYQALEEMLIDAEDILQAFGLHYRVVELCTGDLSFAAAKTYDIEVWAPGSEKYLEVSSVSNFEDFQARRANIRYKGEKPAFLHTLNGSGVATPRLMIAILESFQTSDGGIHIPPVLKPWLDLRV
ncbi:MAG: serine--tRNA ligase [Candidatus Cloacimonadaceae bacterium]|nr:serine--tRNA ligase [Candidatus Cloacimonadaceae bacterium]MDP3113202.1 serine--tRNA ligase [Candidatus Cloacimonadaceae bacterium]